MISLTKSKFIKFTSLVQDKWLAFRLKVKFLNVISLKAFFILCGENQHERYGSDTNESWWCMLTVWAWMLVKKVPCAFSCFPNGLLARERCFGHTNIITALYFKHTIWFNDTRNHDPVSRHCLETRRVIHSLGSRRQQPQCVINTKHI
jgi:hypothetical protein